MSAEEEGGSSAGGGRMDYFSLRFLSSTNNAHVTAAEAAGRWIEANRSNEIFAGNFLLGWRRDDDFSIFFSFLVEGSLLHQCLEWFRTVVWRVDGKFLEMMVLTKVPTRWTNKTKLFAESLLDGNVVCGLFREMIYIGLGLYLDKILQVPKLSLINSLLVFFRKLWMLFWK